VRVKVEWVSTHGGCYEEEKKGEALPRRGEDTGRLEALHRERWLHVRRVEAGRQVVRRAVGTTPGARAVGRGRVGWASLS
jgi:hypothetical protein